VKAPGRAIRAGRRRFRDREEAGRLLAAELARIVQAPAVVAAIPRGGVAVAMPIVEQLHLPLAVVYARKLISHAAPELAFGALDEDGEVIVDAKTVAMLGLSAADTDAAKARVGAEIRRRMALYRVPALAHRPPGASVVLVDDGLATGLTMRAAVAYARRHGAREVIVAVPCASASAAQRLAEEADRVIALVVDEAFLAVGAYYLDFSPVPDRDVLTMLDRARHAGAGPAPAPAPPRPG
jgi:putative phosphoribosyl transferase